MIYGVWYVVNNVWCMVCGVLCGGGTLYDILCVVCGE